MASCRDQRRRECLLVVALRETPHLAVNHLRTTEQAFAQARDRPTRRVRRAKRSPRSLLICPQGDRTLVDGARIQPLRSCSIDVEPSNLGASHGATLSSEPPDWNTNQSRRRHIIRYSPASGKSSSRSFGRTRQRIPNKGRLKILQGTVRALQYLASMKRRETLGQITGIDRNGKIVTLWVDRDGQETVISHLSARTIRTHLVQDPTNLETEAAEIFKLKGIRFSPVH